MSQQASIPKAGVHAGHITAIMVDQCEAAGAVDDIQTRAGAIRNHQSPQLRTYSDAVLQCSQEVAVGKFDDAQPAAALHVLHPRIRLTLQASATRTRPPTCTYGANLQATLPIPLCLAPPAACTSRVAQKLNHALKTAISSTTKQYAAAAAKSTMHTCGSIISGQRLPRVTRMLLSMDVPSLGSPASSHSRTSTGLASVPRSVQFWLTGMASS